MIYLVPALAFIGCIAAWWLATPNAEGTRTLALGNLFLWAGANLCWLSNNLWALPLLDLFLGGIAIVLWWVAPAAWLRFYTNMIAARLILHVLDVLTGHAFTVPYINALNATFAAMLVAVAYPGGWNGCRRLLRGVRRLGGFLPSTAQRGMIGGR